MKKKVIRIMLTNRCAIAACRRDLKANLSGGEALMYREMLLECMAHAKKRDLSSSLVTNCSFAGTVEKTKNILQK